MIKTIRLKIVKGRGSKGLFIAKNITVVKPCNDDNSIICTVSDPKGIEVYESADEIEQMIALETIGFNQQPQTINYPQLERE